MLAATCPSGSKVYALALHRCPLSSNSTGLPLPLLSLAMTALGGLLMLLPGSVALVVSAFFQFLLRD